MYWREMVVNGTYLWGSMSTKNQGSMQWITASFLIQINILFHQEKLFILHKCRFSKTPVVQRKYNFFEIVEFFTGGNWTVFSVAATPPRREKSKDCRRARQKDELKSGRTKRTKIKGNEECKQPGDSGLFARGPNDKSNIYKFNPLRKDRERDSRWQRRVVPTLCMTCHP